MVTRSPCRCGSALECRPTHHKGRRFNSWSRAHTWVAGMFPACGRQPTNVSLSLSVFLSRVFFFSLSLPPFHSLKKKKNQWKKYSPVRINKNKRTIYGKRKKYCRELFKDHIKLSASLISSV